MVAVMAVSYSLFSTVTSQSAWAPWKVDARPAYAVLSSHFRQGDDLYLQDLTQPIIYAYYRAHGVQSNALLPPVTETAQPGRRSRSWTVSGSGQIVECPGGRVAFERQYRGLTLTLCQRVGAAPS